METDQSSSDPAPERLPGPDDVRVEISVRITTGSGSLGKVEIDTILPALLARHRLESSETEVASLIGSGLIGPLRACLRAELFRRHHSLPTAWLDGIPGLADWYELLTHLLSRQGLRLDQQWGAAVGGEPLTASRLESVGNQMGG